jgi:hypothetical protein
MTTTTTENWEDQVTAAADRVAAILQPGNALHERWLIRFTVVFTAAEAASLSFCLGPSLVRRRFADVARKRDIRWNVGAIRFWFTKGPRSRAAKTLALLSEDTTKEARVRVVVWGLPDYWPYGREHTKRQVFDFEREARDGVVTV